MATRLPAGWTEQWSRRWQRTYYFNSATGESLFELPGVGGEEEEGPTSPPMSGVDGGSGAGAGSGAGDGGGFDVAEGGDGGGGDGGGGYGWYGADSEQEDGDGDGGGGAGAGASDGKPAQGAAEVFYNKLQAVGTGVEREASNIYHLRQLQNWIKATLISRYAPKHCERVLDLACGKLGDLNKWSRHAVQYYVGVDIAMNQLKEAVGRLNTHNARLHHAARAIKAKFIKADLGKVHLWTTPALAANEKFDAVSIQFALHYVFECEATALNFFRNIADRLNPGGVFMGTVPDAKKLVRKIRDLPGDELEFGNPLFRVRWTEESKRRQWCLGSNPFGCEYKFALAEAVGDKLEDGVPEYLVPWKLLADLAARVGLRPVCNDNFHDFFNRHSKDDKGRQLLGRLKVLNSSGTIPPDEWEVSGMYRVFAFELPAASPPPKINLPDPLPAYTDRADVLGYAAHLSPEEDILDLTSATLDVASS